jgi:hypothetical protein
MCLTYKSKWILFEARIHALLVVAQEDGHAWPSFEAQVLAALTPLSHHAQREHAKMHDAR